MPPVALRRDVAVAWAFASTLIEPSIAVFMQKLAGGEVSAADLQKPVVSQFGKMRRE